jgi:hypothetical protein
MGKTAAIVESGLVAALFAVGFGSCSSSMKAGGSGGSPDGATRDGPSGSGGSPGAGGALGTGGASGIPGSIPGTGGAPGVGGATGAGGIPGSDAALGTGGLPGSGGDLGTGGAMRGTLGTGGIVGAGGRPGSGGVPATGGASATGGMTGSGGRNATGGATGTGGVVASGGSTATGSTLATGGATGTGGATAACTVGPVPSSGTQHCPSSGLLQGTVGSYAWRAWANGSGACLVTYDNAEAAFSATWGSSSGDFLALVGLEWDGTRNYDELGTITAQFAEKKTGTSDKFSYIGVYGWSVSPCVEWYIVDDSFAPMPITPAASANVGTATIDGGTYTFYTHMMTGTGDVCSSGSSWTQFWSVRQTARQCGQISITEHFNAWKKVGMTVGKIDEAMLLVETMGGSGRVDFTTASMTVQ